jgi:hypothetical protein
MNRILSSQELAQVLKAGARPSLKDLKEMKGIVEVVVTLMMETENLSEIRQGVDEIGAIWRIFSIRAVNWELLRDSEIFEGVLNGLEFVLKVLREGKKVFVHCAAGFHRTGFFLYVLIRLMGLSVNETLKTIHEIRPLVLLKAGKHRLELGEKFYQFCNYQSVLFPFYRVPDIRLGDFLNPELPVFAFFKVFFEDDFEMNEFSNIEKPGKLVKIQYSCTTFNFYKFVLGGELYVRTGENFCWKGKRKVSQSGNSEFRVRGTQSVQNKEVQRFDGEVKEMEEADLILDEFLTSSTENTEIVLVGYQSFFDLEFFSKCCPRVHRRLNSRIIDLKTFRIFGMTGKCYNIYDDLRMCVDLRKLILK